MADLFSGDVITEANEILKLLASTLPKKVDGREAILELKHIDYQWRQTDGSILLISEEKIRLRGAALCQKLRVEGSGWSCS